MLCSAVTDVHQVRKRSLHSDGHKEPYADEHSHVSSSSNSSSRQAGGHGGWVGCGQCCGTATACVHCRQKNEQVGMEGAGEGGCSMGFDAACLMQQLSSSGSSSSSRERAARMCLIRAQNCESSCSSKAAQVSKLAGDSVTDSEMATAP
jgi:hypothetical protein